MNAHDRRKLGAAKFGALAMGAVALGCAALAAFFVGNMLRAKGYTGDRVAQIVVASAEVRAGQPLSRDGLALVDWPEKSVPAGAFTSIEQLFSADAEPVAATGILRGEPVVASRLASTRTGTGIARLVRPNMRAVALEVDDSVGYTGLVYPGAYVDVVVTIKDPELRIPSSRIAVQRARVLTVGADTDVATRRPTDKGTKLSGRPASGGTYVTLEVTPEEAEVLSIAVFEGEVTLALRNAEDDELVETEGASPDVARAHVADDELAAELAGTSDSRTLAATRAARSKPAPTPAPASKKRRIEIRASDEPDVAPANPTRIETYHAR